MQDEVSETENIRKNLAIERMIVEGCDILLDVNQTFVRQGELVGAGTEGQSDYLRYVVRQDEYGVGILEASQGTPSMLYGN